MKKEIETYKSKVNKNYIIEIVKDGLSIEGWIYENQYSIKLFCIGIRDKKNNTEQLLEIIENDIEDFYIPEYNKLIEIYERI